MKKLQMLLADGHIVMRTGLRALLGRQPSLEVIGESENGRETVERAASLQQDVVLMDIGMPMSWQFTQDTGRKGGSYESSSGDR